VYLKNVATVTDGPGEVERVHRIGYGPAYQGPPPADIETNAVTIALAKRTGTNACKSPARSWPSSSACVAR